MLTEKAANWRVLFDLNILLDVLLLREPYLAKSAQVWALAETNQIDGLVAAHSFTTLFYLYRKQVGHEGAYQAMRQLLRVFRVAQVDQTVIERACDLGWPDFEDAVQWVSAGEAACQYLISRNPGDFKQQDTIVIQPADFLAVWAAKNT